MAKSQNSLFLAHAIIYTHALNSGLDADQLVMKMQNDLATLENSLTALKVNYILNIQSCNSTTWYLATCYENLFLLE